MDEFEVIYKILRFLKLSMNYDELDETQLSPEALGVSSNKRDAILVMIFKSGYIDDLGIIKCIGGTGLRTENVKITLKGLEYLKENSLMAKFANAAKGVGEVIGIIK